MNEPQCKRSPKRHLHPSGRFFRAKLSNYAAHVRPLVGIYDPAGLDCLVKQLLDSIRRVKGQRNLNEAIWLAFLAAHFGKHKRDGWTLARLTYGRFGEPGLWDWQSVSANPADFRRWLNAQNGTLRRYRFSNHRQYESLSAESAMGTAAIVESFVNWVAAAGSFDALVRATHRRVGQNPQEVFDALYKDMDVVPRFGRLGKFDYLTMLGKLDLAPIEPGSAYIWDNATGPYRGIRLLVTGSTEGALKRKQADEIYIELGQALSVGMQELEDALCNWQKNQTGYEYFRG